MGPSWFMVSMRTRLSFTGRLARFLATRLGCSSNIHFPLYFNSNTFCQIIGSFSQTFCFPRAVAYLDSGKIRTKGMVSCRRFPLSLLTSLYGRRLPTFLTLRIIKERLTRWLAVAHWKSRSSHNGASLTPSFIRGNVKNGFRKESLFFIPYDVLSPCYFVSSLDKHRTALYSIPSSWQTSRSYSVSKSMDAY